MSTVRVSSSNLEGDKSVIRIYRGNTLIVEEPITKRNPLKYLNTLTRSKHFLNIERKLMPHGLTLTDVGIGKAAVARKQGGVS